MLLYFVTYSIPSLEMNVKTKEGSKTNSLQITFIYIILNSLVLSNLSITDVSYIHPFKSTTVELFGETECFLFSYLTVKNHRKYLT